MKDNIGSAGKLKVVNRMDDKKSASPDVGASRLADGGMTVLGASISNSDFTTSESNGQVVISKFLGHGPNEALIGRALTAAR